MGGVREGPAETTKGPKPQDANRYNCIHVSIEKASCRHFAQCRTSNSGQVKKPFGGIQEQHAEVALLQAISG